MRVATFAFGAAFGFLVAAARLNDYQVIHDMLLLREFDVFLLMGSAVATAAPLIYLLRRRGFVTPLGGPLVVPRFGVTKDTVAGAAVFGGGWAIAGTCPIPAIAMVASGNMLGLPVMAGLASGILLRDKFALISPKFRRSHDEPALVPAGLAASDATPTAVC